MTVKEERKPKRTFTIEHRRKLSESHKKEDKFDGYLNIRMKKETIDKLDEMSKIANMRRSGLIRLILKVLSSKRNLLFKILSEQEIKKNDDKKEK